MPRHSISTHNHENMNPGPTGPTGPVGPIGKEGPPGVTGAQGIKGDRGPKGEDGKSMNIKGTLNSIDDLKLVPNPTIGEGYIIEGILYLYDGAEWDNVGTVTGPTGPQGFQGATGPRGIQGEQGKLGPTGPRGNQGEPGIAGPKGDLGERGSLGPKGDTGEPGPTGPKGSQGENGLEGKLGPTGATGPMGMMGPTGASGVDHSKDISDIKTELNNCVKLSGGESSERPVQPEMFTQFCDLTLMKTIWYYPDGTWRDSMGIEC